MKGKKPEAGGAGGEPGKGSGVGEACAFLGEGWRGLSWRGRGKRSCAASRGYVVRHRESEGWNAAAGDPGGGLGSGVREQGLAERLGLGDAHSPWNGVMETSRGHAFRRARPGHHRPGAGGT